MCVCVGGGLYGFRALCRHLAADKQCVRERVRFSLPPPPLVFYFVTSLYQRSLSLTFPGPPFRPYITPGALSRTRARYYLSRKGCLFCKSAKLVKVGYLGELCQSPRLACLTIRRKSEREIEMLRVDGRHEQIAERRGGERRTRVRRDVWPRGNRGRKKNKNRQEIKLVSSLERETTRVSHARASPSLDVFGLLSFYIRKRALACSSVRCVRRRRRRDRMRDIDAIYLSRTGRTHIKISFNKRGCVVHFDYKLQITPEVIPFVQIPIGSATAQKLYIR